MVSRSRSSKRRSASERPQTPQTAHGQADAKRLASATIAFLLKCGAENAEAVQSFRDRILKLCGLSRAEAEALTEQQLEDRLIPSLFALAPEERTRLARAATQLGVSVVGAEHVLPDAVRRMRGFLAYGYLIPALGIRTTEKGQQVDYLLQTPTETVMLHFDPARFDSYRSDVLRIVGLSKKVVTPEQFEMTEAEFVDESFIAAYKSLSLAEMDRLSERAVNLLGTEGLRAITPIVQRLVKKSLESQFPSLPASDSRKIDPPKQPIHERQMVRDENVVIRPDGTIVRDGVHYRPLSSGAQQAQTHAATLLGWIKHDTKFDGQPLQSYYLAPADKYFISEESIRRVANRFIKLPSNEPAGPVTLGETKDRSGFLGLPDAREILGISNRTMYLWATQKGKAPVGKPLDIIKCTGSGHLYIREKDVYDLKKRVPRSGLQRGRRPQVVLQP